MKYVIVFCIICLYHTTQLSAHTVWAENLPFADKLPSNEMTDIYQDRDGFIWIGTTNGLARYDGYQLQIFKNDLKTPGLLTNNHITCFAEDHKNLWIGTADGLNLFDKTTRRFTTLSSGSLSSGYIKALYADGKETVWVGIQNLLLTFHRPEESPDTLFIPSFDSKSSTINSFYLDREKRLWICTTNGLFTYYPLTKQLNHLPPIGRLNCPATIYQDIAGNFWIATWGEGLWQIPSGNDLKNIEYRHHTVISPRTQTADGRFFSIIQDNAFGYIWTLSYNKLYAFSYSETEHQLIPVSLPAGVNTDKMYTKLLKDRNGNIWLSSYDYGTLLTFHNEEITNFPLNALRQLLNWAPNLLTLNKDIQGRFWFVQDRLGLCAFDPSNNQLLTASPRIRSLTIDARVTATSPLTGGLWVAAPLSNRIYLFTTEHNEIKLKQQIPVSEWSGLTQAPARLVETTHGELWMLCGHRLVFADTATRTAHSTPDSLYFTGFTPSGGNKIWATTHNRLYLVDYINNKIAITEQTIPINLFENEAIKFLCEDGTNKIWMASNMGRVMYIDLHKRSIHDISEQFNSHERTLLNLLIEGNHLWLISHNYIICYNTETGTQHKYTTSDGNMITDIFRDRASCLSDDAKLYAGGRGGFISLTAPQAEPSQTFRDVKLTDARVGMESIWFETAETTTKAKAETPKRLVLDPDVTNLAVSFSALDYANRLKIRYAYRLKGFDKDWIILPEGQNTAFYQRLPKGTYELWVKATDEYGTWQPPHKLIDIRQHPAWYETTVAWFLYCISGLTVIFLLIRLYAQRIQTKNRLQLQEALTQTKLDYFTNVSHELLTPLSVISCVGSYWETKYPSEGHQINILKNNINRLKRLLQQVLDFRKIENQSLSLRVSKGAIVSFAKTICTENFLPVAQRKNIALQLDLPESEYHGWLDFDKVDKILYNLLSNAVKYTPEGKRIIFSVRISSLNNPQVIFSVADEGIGIPEKEQARIFERFYTGSNECSGMSNGIGLSLTKELTNCHHGQLSLQSSPDHGTHVTVIIPVGEDAYTPEEKQILPSQSYMESPSKKNVSEQNTPDIISDSQAKDSPEKKEITVLLVDDNRELLGILSKILSAKYNILCAENGRQALEILNKDMVDLVVTDLMMPDMDGLELCKQIKSHIEISHIPVILLTAKRQSNDRIDCYQAGADGYLSKPFETDILIARIDNLIRSKRQKQKAFRTENHIKLSTLDYPSPDTLFLQTLADYIHAHLDEEHFGIEQLATELNLSKSTLHRKMKAMTGLTPLDFIRNIRLKYACEMLSRHDRTISEIAFATGFSSPKYFTKCFKDEFGMTPTEFQQKNINNPSSD